MDETTRIADQIERAWKGPAWHGPSLRQILEGVSAEQAFRRPIQNAHSIWELVLHAAAWAEAARTSVRTGNTHLSEEENFPVIADTDPAAWEKAQLRLKAAHTELAEAIRGLRHADLAREVSGLHARFSLYVLFHGVVQHSLYHAGQMVLLKKASEH